MHEFVAHHPIQPFIRRGRLVDILVRFDAENHVIEREGRCPGISIVIEILEEYRHFLGRGVVERSPVKCERIFEAPAEVRNHIGVFWIIVE